MTETPNHALQRTATGCHGSCFSRSGVSRSSRIATGLGALSAAHLRSYRASPPRSLSLGSLGASCILTTQPKQTDMKTNNTISKLSLTIANRQSVFHALLLMGLSLGPTLAPVHATPIVVPNFSFESPAVADGGFSLTIASWNISGFGAHQEGVYNPDNAGFPGATGGNLPAPALGPQNAFLNASGDSSMTTASGLATILPLTTYTLTIAIGVRLDYPTVDPALGTFTISLLANGGDISLFYPSSSLTVSASAIPRGTFVDYTASFTTGIGDSTIGQSVSPSIRYINSNVTPGGISVDNVRLDASTVPEPTAGVLLLAGSLLAMNRRKRLIK